jgi:hypothetical protein
LITTAVSLSKVLVEDARSAIPRAKQARKELNTNPPVDSLGRKRYILNNGTAAWVSEEVFSRWHARDLEEVDTDEDVGPKVRYETRSTKAKGKAKAHQSGVEVKRPATARVLRSANRIRK